MALLVGMECDDVIKIVKVTSRDTINWQMVDSSPAPIDCMQDPGSRTSDPSMEIMASSVSVQAAEVCVCTVCSVPLPDTQQRKLYGPTSTDALSLVKELLSTLGFRATGLDEASTSQVQGQPQRFFLPSRWSADRSAAYLCRGCFDSLKKLRKARSQVDRLQAELHKALLATASKRGLQPQSILATQSIPASGE